MKNIKFINLCRIQNIMYYWFDLLISLNTKNSDYPGFSFQLTIGKMVIGFSIVNEN